MATNFEKIDNRPLSKKIITWSTMVLGITLFIFCFITVVVVQIRLNIEQDEHLRYEADFIIKAVSIELGELILDPSIQWEEEHHMEEKENPIFIMIFDKNKSLFYHTEGMSDVTFADEYLVEQKVNDSRVSIINVTKEKIRFIVDPIIEHNEHYGWLVTALRVEGLNKTTNMLLTIYLIAFPFTILITFIGSSITARKAVKPIQQISDAAREIQAKKPNKRLPVPSTGDEITHLAQTLNNLLDQLESNIDTMKKFSQNASHELKSPLVLITSELEHLRKKINDESLSAGFYHIQNEVGRMASIIDTLLNLAKIDSRQVSIKKREVWLNDLVFDEVERYNQKASEKNITFITDQVESISIQGDQYWLSTMVSNLLDNGIKYSLFNSSIEIQIRKSGKKSAIMEIIDSGHGVKPEEIELLTSRFYRQRKDKQKRGTGLGLSIVEWVVKEHNGNLKFENLVNGFKVQIQLPLK